VLELEGYSFFFLFPQLCTVTVSTAYQTTSQCAPYALTDEAWEGFLPQVAYEQAGGCWQFFRDLLTQCIEHRAHSHRQTHN
jgi:hypothetical protein